MQLRRRWLLYNNVRFKEATSYKKQTLAPRSFQGLVRARVEHRTRLRTNDERFKNYNHLLKCQRRKVTPTRARPHFRARAHIQPTSGTGLSLFLLARNYFHVAAHDAV